MPSPSDVWASARVVDVRIMRLWAEKPCKEDLSGRRYATYSSYYGPVTDHFEVSVEPAGVVVRCASEPAREFAERHVGNSTKDGIPIRIVGHMLSANYIAAAKKAAARSAKVERERKKQAQLERERYQRNMLGRPQ